MTISRRAFCRRWAGATAALLVAACTAVFDWREFSWPAGGFSVLLPGKPARDAREVQLGAVRIPMELFSIRVDGATFGVAWGELPAGLDAAARAQLLVDARDGLLRNVSAKQTAEHLVSLDGHVVREFRGEGSRDGRTLGIAGRVVATDTRFYQLVALAPADQLAKLDVPLFLESLKLVR